MYLKSERNFSVTYEEIIIFIAFCVLFKRHFTRTCLPILNVYNTMQKWREILAHTRPHHLKLLFNFKIELHPQKRIWFLVRLYACVTNYSWIITSFSGFRGKEMYLHYEHFSFFAQEMFYFRHRFCMIIHGLMWNSLVKILTYHGCGWLAS